MGNRLTTGIVMAAFTVAAAACSSEAPPAAGSSSGAGKVFFVSPKNGDTIKPMSSIEFGSSGSVTVAAVPPGELKPEQVRPGMIHYHLGLDTDCLPAGAVIPKADPWVHFGDGKKVIEQSLAPGQHRLAVQAGDDMHRTLPGMCEVITVNVAP